jgi:hypothetical protein
MVVDNNVDALIEALQFLRDQKIVSPYLQSHLVYNAQNLLMKERDIDLFIKKQTKLIQVTKRHGQFFALLSNCRNTGQPLPRKNWIIFLHIPGTGGTYLKQNLWPSDDTSVVVHLGHDVLIDGNVMPGVHFPADYPNRETKTLPIENLNGCFVFTTVRNIFDTIYRQACLDHSGKFERIASSDDVERFVRNCMDKPTGMVNRGAIYSPLFAQPSGNLGVDWVNRLETIDDDLDALELTVPVRHQKAQKVNVKVRNVDYRRQYNSQTVDLVEKHWKCDIDLFGFDFERCYKSGNYLHRDVRSFKPTTRYVWEKDALSVRPEKS